MQDYLKKKIEFCKQEEWFKWLKIFSENILNSSYYFEFKTKPSFAFVINEHTKIITSYSFYTSLYSIKYISIECVKYIESNYNIEMILKQSSQTSITTEYDIESIDFLKLKIPTSTYAKSNVNVYFKYFDTNYVKLSIGTFNYLYSSINETNYIDTTNDIIISISSSTNISIYDTTYSTYDLKLTLYKTDNINKLSRFENFTLNSLMLYNLFELSYNII